ncbi:hypothetical protein CL615_00545 [archaeon]|jgi:hypothetical protein|nr:hypothetical protein [archaeon]MDP6548357.1 hypothetical protein [Candidatus Woesearchaeota archaeon]MDP7263837.1 hypothetical protein [Candidatus Woesearchaeota archaeon]HJN56682.1 hypothetical protein [Candidatus Woesearchaeota archaeon]|tara:strand:- start:4122 stop:4763 length:642 start_codon:yes stop_codon:yes gene_type:complete
MIELAALYQDMDAKNHATFEAQTSQQALNSILRKYIQNSQDKGAQELEKGSEEFEHAFNNFHRPKYIDELVEVRKFINHKRSHTEFHLFDWGAYHRNISYSVTENWYFYKSKGSKEDFQFAEIYGLNWNGQSKHPRGIMFFNENETIIYSGFNDEHNKDSIAIAKDKLGSFKEISKEIFDQTLVAYNTKFSPKTIDHRKKDKKEEKYRSPNEI